MNHARGARLAAPPVDGRTGGTHQPAAPRQPAAQSARWPPRVRRPADPPRQSAVGRILIKLGARSWARCSAHIAISHGWIHAGDHHRHARPVAPSPGGPAPPPGAGRTPGARSTPQNVAPRPRHASTSGPRARRRPCCRNSARSVRERDVAGTRRPRSSERTAVDHGVMAPPTRSAARAQHAAVVTTLNVRPGGMEAGNARFSNEPAGRTPPTSVAHVDGWTAFKERQGVALRVAERRLGGLVRWGHPRQSHELAPAPRRRQHRGGGRPPWSPSRCARTGELAIAAEARAGRPERSA